jgi:hypothetical protein
MTPIFFSLFAESPFWQFRYFVCCSRPYWHCIYITIGKLKYLKYLVQFFWWYVYSVAVSCISRWLQFFPSSIYIHALRQSGLGIWVSFNLTKFIIHKRFNYFNLSITTSYEYVLYYFVTPALRILRSWKFFVCVSK